MAIEDKIEEEVFSSLNKVLAVPHKAMQEQIFKNVIASIMVRMGWDEAKLVRENDHENDRQGNRQEPAGG